MQVDLDGNGMLELGNAANSISGLTGSGALNNGSALEITTAGNALYEGSLSGEGSITMNGTGTQVLKGNGAIGQALSVTKGTLELTVRKAATAPLPIRASRREAAPMCA